MTAETEYVEVKIPAKVELVAKITFTFEELDKLTDVIDSANSESLPDALFNKVFAAYRELKAGS